MLPNLAIPLALGVLAAMANVFGGLVLTGRDWERRYLRYFIALGAGFMLAAVLLEMLPQSMALCPASAPLLLLAGYLLVHLVEHALVAHFHFGEETHASHLAHGHLPWSVMAGLAIHTFFDGVAIGSGFLVSSWLGWIIFLAVFLHKIPEGFTVASVMLASGQSSRIAWGASVLLGGATLAGVLTMVLLRHEVGLGLPLSGGVTIYVAASDLMPEVNKEPGGKMAVLVLLGAGVFFLLDRIVH